MQEVPIYSAVKVNGKKLIDIFLDNVDDTLLSKYLNSIVNIANSTLKTFFLFKTNIKTPLINICKVFFTYLFLVLRT